MNKPVITPAEAIAINTLILGRDGRLRDPGLLASALHRPYTEVFGYVAYPDPWQKAAALLHSLTMNHPFLDGNKRTAMVCTLVLLDVEGVADVRTNAEALEDALFAIAVEVAIGKLAEVDDIASRLRAALS